MSDGGLWRIRARTANPVKAAKDKDSPSPSRIHDLLALQRMARNDGVVQRLADPPPADLFKSKAAVVRSRIESLQRLAGNLAVSSLCGATPVVQRKINMLPGTSSGRVLGVLNKGRRDKINDLVTKFNTHEAKGLKSLEDFKESLKKAEEIRDKAVLWKKQILGKKVKNVSAAEFESHVQRQNAKAEDIQRWLDDQVDPEIKKVNSSITALQEKAEAAALAAALKGSWDAAARATAKPKHQAAAFTAGSALETPGNWLRDPELGPVFEYYCLTHLLVDEVKAWKEVNGWNGSKDSALALYKKYELGTVSKLNLGAAVPTRLQEQIAAIEGGAAVPPDLFTGVKRELDRSLADVFQRQFMPTEQFKRLTGAKG